jgi:hypothetical protein
MRCRPQEAAAQAPQLSREEMKAMRRANDPNFKPGERRAVDRQLLPVITRVADPAMPR